MAKKFDITIGLIGNPNVGKSTLFNFLTGARQHVGNWPGKTVEKKEGEFDFKNKKIKIVDLPGAYSLTAYTEEEVVTSDFIFQEKPDAIVQIIDAQNFERNLFMTIQLLELGAPLFIALNMMNLAKEKGIFINEKKLSELLNVPVVIIDARCGSNIDVLLKKIFEQKQLPEKERIKLKYNNEVNDELRKIKNFIYRKEKIDDEKLNWLILKLLEEDFRVKRDLNKKSYYFELNLLVKKSIYHLKQVFGKDINNILANTRYGFIKGLSKEVVIRKKLRKKISFSERFDEIATNKFFGIPLFLLIALLLFQITFKLSEPLVSIIESFFDIIKKFTTDLLIGWNMSEWFVSLITSGIIDGVGGVLVFVPIIGILFFLLAILEDSGYLARVAYIMDKLMHKIGLHGKAFIPLILGFGCNVPAIMATRTLETKKDRLLAILINPFMSCGARLPVYMLFTGIFFSDYQGWVIFSLYILGIFVAIIVGLVLKKLLFKSLSSPFVIELPSYRWPSIKGVLIHSWERVWQFIKKAGTIILAFSIIIWFLASMPFGVEYSSEQSIAGSIGKIVAPVFEPLGFGNWQSSMALMFGFVAKEIIVSTFGSLYGISDIENESSFQNALQNDFTPLSAYAFMVFVLLYIPCLATLAVIKKETGSWKWSVLVIGYTTFIAWLVAFIVFQGGKLLGFE